MPFVPYRAIISVGRICYDGLIYTVPSLVTTDSAALADCAQIDATCHIVLKTPRWRSGGTNMRIPVMRPLATGTVRFTQNSRGAIDGSLVSGRNSGSGERLRGFRFTKQP
jgi:hypothetical protein